MVMVKCMRNIAKKCFVTPSYRIGKGYAIGIVSLVPVVILAWFLYNTYDMYRIGIYGSLVFVSCVLVLSGSLMLNVFTRIPNRFLFFVCITLFIVPVILLTVSVTTTATEEVRYMNVSDTTHTSEWKAAYERIFLFRFAFAINMTTKMMKAAFDVRTTDNSVYRREASLEVSGDSLQWRVHSSSSLPLQQDDIIDRITFCTAKHCAALDLSDTVNISYGVHADLEYRHIVDMFSTLDLHTHPYLPVLPFMVAFWPLELVVVYYLLLPLVYILATMISCCHRPLYNYMRDHNLIGDILYYAPHLCLDRRPLLKVNEHYTDAPVDDPI